MNGIDQGDWPAHLRDDAPYLVCLGCGRQSWSPTQRPGDLCSMPQPNGSLCVGAFADPTTAALDKLV